MRNVKLWFIALLCLTGAYANASGDLLQFTLVKRFPEPELKSFFKLHKIPSIVLPVNSGINIYEVVYTTTYPDKSDVQASGLLYVPIPGRKNMPLMIYNHGTEMCRERSCDFTGEQSICLAFATDGYVVLAPDYLGLGKSDKAQLYLNAEYESQASVDMLKAVKKLLPDLKVEAGNQLFVTGYSQGGHASMATTRLLQQQYSQQFPVTASAPMSGPYNLEHTVYEGRKGQFKYPAFFFLLLQSYYESMGDFKSLATVLKSPYDTLIPPLLDGETPGEEIDKLLPASIFSTIRPHFINEFENDSNSGFRKYLRSNNVYNWKPEMPMQLCYCDADEEVDYRNSINAYQTMKANGSKTVELWRAGKKFKHVNCALFAVIYTKMFFDGFRQGHPGSHGPLFKRMLLNLGKLGVKPE